MARKGLWAVGETVLQYSFVYCYQEGVGQAAVSRHGREARPRYVAGARGTAPTTRRPVRYDMALGTHNMAALALRHGWGAKL